MNLLELFRSGRNATDHRSGAVKARMTWASASMSQSLRSTRTYLKKNLWLWPIIAVIVPGIPGVSVRRAIETTMKT